MKPRHGPPRFYVWKKKYAGLGVPELRKLRQLEEENQKLKQLVADLSLDNRPAEAANASGRAQKKQGRLSGFKASPEADAGH